MIELVCLVVDLIANAVTITTSHDFVPVTGVLTEDSPLLDGLYALAGM